MNQYNGFTPRAAAALEGAQRAAQQAGHTYIGSEHLLLALLREGAGAAYTLLFQRRVTAGKTERALLQMVGRGHPTLLESEETTVHYRAAVEEALREAQMGGFLQAGTEHLLLALCGLFFACILGLVFGILSVLKNRACNIIATVFVDIIRGVPMIVLAFYVYFAVPMLLNNILHLNTMLGMKGQITFSALQAGTICLALNCGAYMAEIIRAGIESVDKGQMEAARSLGLPYWRAMYRVVLPQAIRTMIPSIINQFIITLKDTSILSVIGFPELVNTAKNVVANTMSAFQVWTIVAVMYLVVITLLSRLAKKVERRLNRGRQ